MAEISISDKFMPFMKSKARFQMLKGGRGGMKSHHAGLKMIFGIMGIDPDGWKKTTKPFRGVMSRDTHENIRDGQYAEIVDLIKLYELEDRIHVGKSPFSFYCPETGFNILAKATTQSRKSATSKTKGIKDPTMVWVDELPDLEEDHFRKLSMSIRKEGSDCQIICSHNTDIPPEHWVRKNFYQEERPDTYYLHTTYLDNIANLNEGAIQEYEYLQKIDPDLYAVEVLGKWGSKKVTSPFANQYNEKIHRKPCEFVPTIPLNISLDFNLDPFAFIYYQFWRDADGYHFYIFKEETIEGGTISEACNRIKQVFKGHLHLITITGDYSGTHRQMAAPDKASMYQQLLRGLGLRKSQLDIRPNPTHLNSRSDCNYMLMHFPDFRIDPSCLMLDRDMRTVEINPDGKIKKSDRSKTEQKADHLDAFRYSVNSRKVLDWIRTHQKTNNR